MTNSAIDKLFSPHIEREVKRHDSFGLTNNLMELTAQLNAGNFANLLEHLRVESNKIVQQEQQAILDSIRARIEVMQKEAERKAQQHNKIYPEEKTVAAIWAGIDLKLAEVLEIIDEQSKERGSK